MRKQITDTRQQTAVASEKWLNVPAIAIVEVSSEADGYPIENALAGMAKEKPQT